MQSNWGFTWLMVFSDILVKIFFGGWLRFIFNAIFQIVFLLRKQTHNNWLLLCVFSASWPQIFKYYTQQVIYGSALYLNLTILVLKYLHLFSLKMEANFVNFRIFCLLIFLLLEASLWIHALTVLFIQYFLKQKIRGY